MSALIQPLHEHCDQIHLIEMINRLKQNELIQVTLHNSIWNLMICNKKNCEKLKSIDSKLGWGMIFADMEGVSEYYKITRPIFKKIHATRKSDQLYWLCPSEYFKRLSKDHSIDKVGLYFCHDDWLFRMLEFIYEPLVFTYEYNDNAYYIEMIEQDLRQLY